MTIAHGSETFKSSANAVLGMLREKWLADLELVENHLNIIQEGELHLRHGVLTLPSNTFHLSAEGNAAYLASCANRMRISLALNEAAAVTGSGWKWGADEEIAALRFREAKMIEYGAPGREVGEFHRYWHRWVRDNFNVFLELPLEAPIEVPFFPEDKRPCYEVEFAPDISPGF